MGSGVQKANETRLLPLVVVEQRVRVGHAKEEPSKALVVGAVGRVLHKEATDERPVWSDAGAGGDLSNAETIEPSGLLLRHQRA